jgi:hypothetical protein
LLSKEIAAQYETVIKKAWDSDEFKEFMTRRGFDMFGRVLSAISNLIQRSGVYSVI